MIMRFSIGESISTPSFEPSSLTIFGKQTHPLAPNATALSSSDASWAPSSYSLMPNTVQTHSIQSQSKVPRSLPLSSNSAFTEFRAHSDMDMLKNKSAMDASVSSLSLHQLTPRLIEWEVLVSGLLHLVGQLFPVCWLDEFRQQGRRYLYEYILKS
ncbi:unnamed protein product [Protopolystoma xenopodis]|uniref:Uncharacterized protein n=1 Tax=Protopolystoma xenopodis TaxID=117903 RepID=A0A448XEY3_9PLAT|nr:unnamed protein product [Protopolystoma xenopodis]